MMLIIFDMKNNHAKVALTSLETFSGLWSTVKSLENQLEIVHYSYCSWLSAIIASRLGLALQSPKNKQFCYLNFKVQTNPEMSSEKSLLHTI